MIKDGAAESSATAAINTEISVALSAGRSPEAARTGISVQVSRAAAAEATVSAIVTGPAAAEATAAGPHISSSTAAASGYDGAVTFLLGDGQRHFNAISPATNIAPEAQASAAADLNGDGRMDLVVATSCGMDTVCGGSLSILLQSPVQSVSPPALVFPGQNLGVTSGSQPITIANNGSAPLTVSAVVIAAGANTGAADFAQTNSCGALPFKIASGANCVLAVTFTASNGGAESATLTITTNDPNSPNGATVNLSGTGNAFQTQMTVTAPAITYGANGSVVVAITSPAGTVTGNVSLTVDGGNPQTLPLTAGSATFSIPSLGGGAHERRLRCAKRLPRCLSYGLARGEQSRAVPKLHGRARDCCISKQLRRRRHDQCHLYAGHNSRRTLYNLRHGCHDHPGQRDLFAESKLARR